MNMHLAQSMAAIVISHRFFEARIQIFYTGYIGEEAGKLEDPAFHLMQLLFLGRTVFKQLGEVMGDHRAAGPGRHHDTVGMREDPEEMLGDLTGLGTIAAIESGLSAAGLAFGKINFKTKPFQHVGHRQPDFGKDLIYYAGNKNRNAGSWH